MVVNHLDGNKGNNRVSNLEWTTAKGNSAHAITTGLFNFKGEKNLASKLDDGKVREIIRLLADGRLTGREIAQQFQVTAANVSSIATGKSWPHIPRPEGATLSRYWGGKKSWHSR